MEALKRLESVLDKVDLIISGAQGENDSELSLDDDITSSKSNLSNKQIKELIDSFNNYQEIIDPGLPDGDRPEPLNQVHFKRFLRKFDLKVSDKVFEKLKDDYILEVYSTDQRQLFRSVNFFSFSSYDLATLTFVPWDKLFTRSEVDFQKMVQLTNYVMENEIDLMSPSGTKHILEEIVTARKFTYELKHLGKIVTCETDVLAGLFSIIKVKELKGQLGLVQ